VQVAPRSHVIAHVAPSHPNLTVVPAWATNSQPPCAQPAVHEPFWQAHEDVLMAPQDVRFAVPVDPLGSEPLVLGVWSPLDAVPSDVAAPSSDDPFDSREALL
jgi:hypothetical protein